MLPVNKMSHGVLICIFPIWPTSAHYLICQ